MIRVFLPPLWEGAKSVMRGKIDPNYNKSRNKQQTKKTLRWLLEAKQDPEVEGGLRFTGRTYDDLGNRASRLLAVQLRKAQSSQVVRRLDIQ